MVDDNPLGLPEAKENDNKIMVSPNPFTNRVDLKSRSGQLISYYRITDVNGAVCAMSKELNLMEINVDLSGLSAGIYILESGSVDHWVSYYKIVKR